MYSVEYRQALLGPRWAYPLRPCMYIQYQLMRPLSIAVIEALVPVGDAGDKAGSRADEEAEKGKEEQSLVMAGEARADAEGFMRVGCASMRAVDGR